VTHSEVPDEGSITALMMLDLSAAFDVINYPAYHYIVLL